MGLFANIPLRQNDQDILYSWFDSLRAAGVAVENFLGGSFLPETNFTIANNQSSPANVTGLSFSGASVRSFKVSYQIYRNTTGGGATEIAERGELLGVFSTVANTWEMAYGTIVGDSGVELSITSAGQIQYTSSNITGTLATSKMSFKAETMGV